MQLSYKTPIWLYSEPVDFRKQIDGLVLLIASELALEPTNGELFLFRNRTAAAIKLLWYDGNGFWLCYKRLEKGRLRFPKNQAEVMQITQDQLSWLLSGLDILAHQELPKTNAKKFF